MSEAKKALIKEPFNFADLFCQMGDPVVVIREENPKNKIMEALEDVEKNFSAIMKMLKLMIIQPKKQMSLHKK